MLLKHFTYNTYQTYFKDIPAVIEHMLELHDELADTDLHHLRAFTLTYLIITKNVLTKLKSGDFTYPNTMNSVDILFAKYYFNALKLYIETGTTIPAWKILFDHCKEKNLYQFVYMALGVNAHVNNDLGLTLYDVLDDTKFKKDFDKVNSIITYSLYQVLYSLEEKSLIMSTTIKNSPALYALLMNRIIRKWRTNAWNNFIKLRSQTITNSQIEINASAVAARLAQVQSIRKSYKLYAVLHGI